MIDQIVARRGYLLNIASLSAVAHAPLMGPYTATKAGVEALTDALRMETAPSGARVGCAYFGFIDTDLVKASYAQPAAQRINARTPAFLRDPIPVSRAVAAIKRGIERRSARVWAPRWVGPMIAVRGLLQPLLERRSSKSRPTSSRACAWPTPRAVRPTTICSSGSPPRRSSPSRRLSPLTDAQG